jgi:hypothetical protein
MLSSTCTTDSSADKCIPYTSSQKPKTYGDKKNIYSVSMDFISKKLFISKNYQIKSIRSQKG